MAYAEPENMTSVIDLFEYSNSVSDGFFGLGLLISIYLIIIMYLNGKGDSFGDSAIVAGYITSILAIFLFLAGLITGYYMFGAFFISAISMFLNYYNKS